LILAITLIFESEDVLDVAVFAADPQAAVPDNAAMATQAANTRFAAVPLVELKNADNDIVPYFPNIHLACSYSGARSWSNPSRLETCDIDL
jgi:hypothetical protein